MQKKLKLHTTLAILLVGLIACQPSANNSANSTDTELPGKGQSVRPVQSTLLEDNFSLEIVNIALEKLGYQVNPGKELDAATFHVVIASGDLDYSALHYEKLHRKFFENAGGQEKMKRVGILVPNTVQGYQIDKKTADRYNITNIQQLKDPEIARIFDSDGDGKANLVGCNPGWGCELIIEHHLDAYGLRDTVEHNKGKYTALIADAMTRYKQGQPVIFYTWTPHWLGTVLKPAKDVVWLEVPYTAIPKEQGNLTTKDTSVDGKNLGFPIDQIRIVANNEFLANNPSAKRLFELVQIPIEDINAQNQLIQKGQNTPEDLRRHAQEWIQNNQYLFDSWLEKAREAANIKSLN